MLERILERAGGPAVLILVFLAGVFAGALGVEQLPCPCPDTQHATAPSETGDVK